MDKVVDLKGAPQRSGSRSQLSSGSIVTSCFEQLVIIFKKLNKPRFRRTIYLGLGRVWTETSQARKLFTPGSCRMKSKLNWTFTDLEHRKGDTWKGSLKLWVIHRLLFPFWLSFWTFWMSFLFRMIHSALRSPRCPRKELSNSYQLAVSVFLRVLR